MKLIIPGTLPNLNDYINAERTNKYKAAKMKNQAEQLIISEAKKQLRGCKLDYPVFMAYIWFEKSKRRDLDNISSFGRKVIQDALVKAKILKNDGWNEIAGFSDTFFVDKKNPRIEVEIRGNRTCKKS